MTARLILIFTAFLSIGNNCYASTCREANCAVLVNLDWSSKTISLSVDGQPVDLDNNRFSASSYGGFWCSGRDRRLPIEECADNDRIFNMPMYGYIGPNYSEIGIARGPFSYITSSTVIVGAVETYKTLGGNFDHRGHIILVSKSTAEAIKLLVQTRGPKNVWVDAHK